MPPLVVIIDDDVDLLHMIERQLERVGASARSFTLAASALRFLEHNEGSITAVCVDLALPDVSGFEVCERLKADPALEGVPVIVMSGRVGLDEEARALEAGADVFLSKPFRARQLLDELEPYLADARTPVPEVSG